MAMNIDSSHLNTKSNQIEDLNVNYAQKQIQDSCPVQTQHRPKRQSKQRENSKKIQVKDKDQSGYVKQVDICKNQGWEIVMSFYSEIRNEKKASSVFSKQSYELLASAIDRMIQQKKSVIQLLKQQNAQLVRRNDILQKRNAQFEFKISLNNNKISIVEEKMIYLENNLRMVQITVDKGFQKEASFNDIFKKQMSLMQKHLQSLLQPVTYSTNNVLNHEPYLSNSRSSSRHTSANKKELQPSQGNSFRIRTLEQERVDIGQNDFEQKESFPEQTQKRNQQQLPPFRRKNIIKKVN